MQIRALPAIAEEAFAVFKQDAATRPPLTLRGGNALDEYTTPPEYDVGADAPTDEYLEANCWGIGYLDPTSFRHYLPHLIAYASRHSETGSNVVDALLNSLRPPDRDPPRLASLTEEQEEVVVELLDALAFSNSSAHKELATTALEEWWAPGALFRPSKDDA